MYYLEDTQISRWNFILSRITVHILIQSFINFQFLLSHYTLSSHPQNAKCRLITQSNYNSSFITKEKNSFHQRLKHLSKFQTFQNSPSRINSRENNSSPRLEREKGREGRRESGFLSRYDYHHRRGWLLEDSTGSRPLLRKVVAE